MSIYTTIHFLYIGLSGNQGPPTMHNSTIHRKRESWKERENMTTTYLPAVDL